MTNAASPSPLPSKKTPLSVLGFSYDFTVLNASLLVFGIVSGFFVYYKRHALFSRIKTAAHLVPSHFRRRLELKGVALFVTDGDNLRFFHTPLTWRFCSQAKLLKVAKNNIKDETINIRLAGIDAPEMAHFGREGQPHAAESFNWLKRKVEGRRVVVRPLRIDRYGRCVASVWYYRWWGLRRVNLSVEMVRAGKATIYEGAGAEYDGLLGRLQALESAARKRRLGMWTQLRNGTYVSPAQYKREFSTQQ